jgi:5'/3'-nucleotidase SurE
MTQIVKMESWLSGGGGPFGIGNLARMSHLLIVNDDGVNSPALVPLARALGALGPIEVVVPDRERSWVSKAITRYEEVHVERADREGIAIHTTTGFPADCTQLGIHSLFDHPPHLVVSGINIGYNQGSAYLLSSGTVGAAVESWISGVPALAFHAGTSGDWPTWARRARTSESLPMWERLASVAADIVATLVDHGFPAGARASAAPTSRPRAGVRSRSPRFAFPTPGR